MSEYQYYEFLAVDRPLSVDDQRALRAMSSRARITATGFTNHCEWGNLKAAPTRLLLRYFGLHVHVVMGNQEVVPPGLVAKVCLVRSNGALNLSVEELPCRNPTCMIPR